METTGFGEGDRLVFYRAAEFSVRAHAANGERLGPGLAGPIAGLGLGGGKSRVAAATRPGGGADDLWFERQEKIPPESATGVGPRPFRSRRDSGFDHCASEAVRSGTATGHD